MTYTDYRKDFDGLNKGDNLALSLNYIDTGHRDEDNEIFFDVDSDGDNAYVAMTLSKAKALRDHLNFLIEKATYVAPIEVDVNPADPSHYVSLSNHQVGDEEKFDFRDQFTTYTTNTAVLSSTEPKEFDAEKTASQINDLYEALVGSHDFLPDTADLYVRAFIRSGGLNS